MHPQQSTTPPPADLITISSFPNVRGTAKDITLAHFIDVVAGRIPNRHAAIISTLRATDKTADKETYSRIKSTLPAVTISCRCSPGQTHAHHDGRHTGVIAVDIDGADNPGVTEWPTLRTALGELPYCYLSALSAGGRGVFLLLAVDPDQPQAMIWEALKRYFAESLKITIDKNCGNLNRLRLLSYDPGAIVRNPTTRFKAVQRIAPVEMGKLSTKGNKPRNRHAYAAHNGNDDNDRIRAAVEVWSRRGIALNDYADWLKAAAALQSLPDGAELFHVVSRNSPKYEPTDTARKYRQAHLQRVNAGSFLYLCRHYGITDNEINEALRAMRATPTPQQPHRNKFRS